MSVTKVPERKMEEVKSPRGIEPEKVSFWDYSNGKLKQVNIHPKKLNSDESFIQNFMKLHDPIVTDRTLVHVATNDDEHYHIVVLDKESTGNDDSDANDWIKRLEEKGKLGAGHIAGMVIGGSALLGFGYHVASKLALKYEVQLLLITGQVVVSNFEIVRENYQQHFPKLDLQMMFNALEKKWVNSEVLSNNDKMTFILSYTMLSLENEERAQDALKAQCRTLTNSQWNFKALPRYQAFVTAITDVNYYNGSSVSLKRQILNNKFARKLFLLQNHVIQLHQGLIAQNVELNHAFIIITMYCQDLDKIIELMKSSLRR
jgi:hypothetical protein